MGRMSSEPLDFDCPRCSAPAAAATYGPCGVCRDDLRRKFAGPGQDMDVGRYEPKMNVVPNQVAFKD